MKVRLAETAGFCMGVRRAVNTAVGLVQQTSRPIYTLGQLVHNPQVVALLEGRGVKVISPEDIDTLGDGTVVVRAHGVPPEVTRRLTDRGLDVVDATCPRVVRIQKIIQRHTASGGHVVIVGDRDHPETVGLKGFAGQRGYVIERPAEVDTLPEDLAGVIVVSQTTQDVVNFRETAARLKSRYPEAVVHDTICDSTHNRQQEVRQLAQEVDCVVVVGGRNSANTRRLAEIAQECGTPTQMVETAEELDVSKLKGMETVGLTAGASTPNWMIINVLEQLYDAARHQAPGPVGRLLNLGHALLGLNLLTMLGGFCAATASVALQKDVPLVGDTWIAMVSAALYILSMHTWNHFTDRRRSLLSSRSSVDSTRVLVTLSVGALVASLAAAWRLGPWAFGLVVVFSLAGLLYRLPLVPRHNTRRGGLGLSNIPGSKDLFTAGAWAAVCVVLPRLALGLDPFATGMVVPTVFVAGLVLVRSVVLDVRDMQTDRIVGIETLPMLLGIRRTKVMLVSLLATVAAGLLVGAATTLSPMVPGLLLLLCVVYALAYLVGYHRRLMNRDVWCQAAADTSLVLAGPLVLIWFLVG
ncbi:MAG: 4-hydroxy-3-methylbut-2-enyl diphosphate reductase [Planctomycetota bacterium]